ncbi:MAG: homoserine dehydrogenase, partial [Sphingobacteriales bacterium]
MSIQNTKLAVGLFGFGVVGEGLYQTLTQTPGLDATIKKICIRQPDIARNAPQELFTTDADSLLNDPGINVIIELTNDPEAAFRIVTTAFLQGKHVISAGKKMIAENLEALLDLQKKHQVSFLYEGAACASIPVIRNLEEYYDNDLLHAVSGIVNGSTNYILTRIFDESLDIETALLQAQIAGFAETDPSLDIEGTDAAHKLVILLLHAYGLRTHISDFLYSGITGIHEEDARYAREKGYRIRLVAQSRKQEDGSVAAFVLPQFVGKDSQLYTVND